MINKPVFRSTAIFKKCPKIAPTPYRFTAYSGWSGKAQRADDWRPKDIFIYAIDNDGQDRSVLCPLRPPYCFQLSRRGSRPSHLGG